MTNAYIFNLASELWGKKWRMALLYVLKDGPLRFSEIKRALPHISVKVLSEVLQDMEKYNLIVRTQFNSIPVKVTYHIHADLQPILDGLEQYRSDLIDLFYKNQDRLKLPDYVIQALEEETAKRGN